MKKIMICLLALLVLITMTLTFVACGEVEPAPSGNSSTKDTGGSVTGSASGSVDDGGSDTTDTSAGGDDTTDTSVGGDTIDTSAGGDTTDTSVGGDTTDTSTGGDTTDTSTGGDTTDTSVGGDTTDTSAGGDDTTDTSVGGDTTDTSIGGNDTTDTSTGGSDTTDSSTGGDNPDDGGNDNPGDDTVKECTHESTRGDVIRFSDYGSQCGGGIYFDECLDCGEVSKRVDTLITLCTYENGESGKCTECGLEISKAVTQNGCEATVVYSATFGDTEIFKELSTTSTEHTFAVKITERIEKNCLITVATEKCKNCDFTNLLSTLHEGGELEVTNGQADEKSIRTRSCTDCGYKEIRGFTETIDCIGELSGLVELSLYNGEELLYSGKTERRASHSWQTKSVKYGNECKDGAAVIKACNTCSQGEYEITFDHVVTEEKINVDYADTCGGTMTVEKCSACDKVMGIAENPSNCHFMQTDSDYVGGFLKTTYKCVDCGLELASHGTQTEISDCEVKVREFTTITQNGEAVFTAENEYIVKSHYDSSYDITYELLGESCLDGIITTYVCKKCGYTGRRVETYVELHKSKGEEEIRIDTPCGSILSSSPCICGAVKSISTFDGCTFLTSGEDSVEIDGVRFSVTTKTCADCGVVYIHKYGTVDDGCNLHYYEQKEYVLHEATIYDTGMCDTYIAPKHTKEEKSMAIGPFCEIDGMLMVEVCEKCDYTNYYAYGYHYKTEVERIDLIEYGACGGYIDVKRCPCDKGEEQGVYGGYTCNLKQSIEEDENGSFNRIVCEDCGFTMVEEIKYIYENCQKITDDTVTFLVGENVIYEYKPTHEPKVAHRLESTFTLLAEHCYEGLYEVSKCMDCDYEMTTTHYTCIVKESYEFGFREYGVCDGAYYYRNCYCGDMFNEYYSLFCDTVEVGSETETIDGITYTTTTLTCETCGVIETVVSYLNLEGCYEYSYSVYNVSIGEKVLAEDVVMKAYMQSYHEMERTIKLLGESCKDGFYDIDSCTKCDNEISLYYDEHNLYQKYTYYGGGDCVHSVLYYECPCAEAHELRISSVDETENGYACDRCGLKVIEDTVTEKENCKERATVTTQVYLGEELQVECVDTYTYDSHSFDAPVLSNQDGKEVITSKCADCDLELLQEVYILVYEEGDWGVKCELSLAFDEDGEYTVYVSSAVPIENYILNSKGESAVWLYPNGDKRPVAMAELKKDESYEFYSVDYQYSINFGALVLINGQYEMCEEADETIKLITSDGKYELTLCASCHMILDVQEAPVGNE